MFIMVEGMLLMTMIAADMTSSSYERDPKATANLDMRSRRDEDSIHELINQSSVVSYYNATNPGRVSPADEFPIHD